MQIPALREECKTELEQLLSLFDQRRVTPNDEHILEVDETAYPEKYRPLVRLLHHAVSNEEIRDVMDVEDEILRDFENLERHIDRQDEIIEKQGKALGEKDKALEEKDKALEELRRQLQQLQAPK
uniref:Uncharacterized protein n=1 Tax=Candidatus Kentrum sp. FW TaxID=2126338 RepID=A0A450TMG2_9GAMM|nr:MAG: hypothetical protein BECKFW1821C_GA0114237_101656 [Candidatus Kentron sp. FW]